MANQYLVADLGAANESAATTWENTPGGGEDSGPPAIGDIVVMNVAGTNVTLDQAITNAYGSLNMTGFTGTLIMGVNDLDVDGNVTLDGTLTGTGISDIFCKGNFETISGIMFDVSIRTVLDAATGAITITSNGVGIGLLTVNDAGGDATFTMQDDLTALGVAITDGAFSTGNFDLTVSGGGISGTGGEFAFGTSTVDADIDDIDLDNITATVGLASWTAANVLTGAGSLTMSDDLTLTGSFDLEAGGTLDMGNVNNVLSVSASYTYTTGTMANNGILEMTGTGNLHSGSTNVPNFLQLTSILNGDATDADVTLTGTSTFKTGMDIPEGATLNLVAQTLSPYLQTGNFNDTLHCEGDITATTGKVNIYPNQSLSNSLVCNFGSVRVIMAGYDDDTWTQTGAFTCGALAIYDHHAGHAQTFDISGNLTAANVVLGLTGNKSGILNLGGGMHSIASLTDAGATDLNNALDLDKCHLECSGILNGDNITVTSTGANLHGGTIRNADVTGVLHCWGVTDGGSNSVDVAHEGSNAGAALGGTLTRIAI